MMKLPVPVLLFTLISFLWLSQPSGAAAEDTVARYRVLDARIDSLAEDGELSGAFLYSRKGKILYEKAVGLLHPHSGGAILPTSSFNLASVSKHFTAVVVMLLQHKGKLEYDKPVSGYLPKFPYRDITVRHLLNHTSGLSDYMALVNNVWEGDLFTNQSLVELYHTHKPPLEFAPGSRFSYSNTGYVFLAAIVEAVSNGSLEQFMDTELFSPLSMKDSGVFNLLSDPGRFKSRVFGQHAGELNDLNFLDGGSGDGAVYSSVRDLLTWHNALTEGRVLPLSALQEAFKPAVLSDGKLSYYGFGWQLYKDKPHIMEHDGAWVGFNTYMIRNTQTDSLLVLLTNDSGGVGVDELINRFFKIAKPDF